MTGNRNRILWNRRPSGNDHGDIDELVLRDVAMVHVEQMDDNAWWIGIGLANGEWWSGDFTSDGPMTFTEQESSVTFGDDDCHGEAT